jgi:pimeloyl-ACP methyl ester carboxylesterase
MSPCARSAVPTSPLSEPDAPAGTIVFSHGNGFPAGTYRLLFEAWRAAGYRVEAIERYGHDAAFPVTSNWPHLRDQLIQFIEGLQVGPVCLVGHSLGGMLSLLAASRRPDLARGLVMLDSPIVTGWRAHSVQVMKRSGLMRRVSPGRVSQRRRHLWPDRESVYHNFKPKAVFARWDDRVLRDYVQSGFEERDGQVHLRFSREVETLIYNTLPHHLGGLMHKHPPRCPVGFVAGTQSAEMRQGGMGGAHALAGQRFVKFEGTHLYAMERPDDTAALVLDLLRGMA